MQANFSGNVELLRNVGCPSVELECVDCPLWNVEYLWFLLWECGMWNKEFTLCRIECLFYVDLWNVES
jgi:hypothetical protein